MGRRRKLPEIAKIEGNPGKRPIFDVGVDGLGEPFVPEHLHEDAQGCIEVIKRSMPPDIYSRLDSFLLAGFGMAWAIHKRAAIEIKGPSFSWLVLNASGNEVANPWIRILNSQAMTMASLGDRLGLDPKARAALRLPGERPKSKFDGLVGQTESSRSLNN